MIGNLMLRQANCDASGTNISFARHDPTLSKQGWGAFTICSMMGEAGCWEIGLHFSSRSLMQHFRRWLECCQRAWMESMHGLQ